MRKPFFGELAWEWQIGPIVVQRFYARRWNGKTWACWYDPYWKA